jgi:opacity protein-like surface antigen
MKKMGVLAAAMAMAFLFVGVASAEMYVEGYLGAAQAGNVGKNFTIHDVVTTTGAPPVNWQVNSPGTTDVTVLGGVKLGTWFVPEGFAGLSYPSWMRYFGFYTDFSYQRLSFRAQTLRGSDSFQSNGAFIENVSGQFKSDGMVATWAFMFAGRYGFFPDSEVPFGRLQPYVAVGPAIMWSSMKPKLGLTSTTNLPGTTILGLSPGTQSSTNIALAVDAGIRYMCLKNVSIDISFKYRYAQPGFDFTGMSSVNAPIVGPRVSTFKLDPAYNLFSGQVGVAYHF